MPKLKCPRCGSTKTVPIVYGMPSHELFKAAQRGEVVLGGCCIDIDGSPMRACNSCDYQFKSGKLASLLLSDAFKSFEFNIGGYFGINHRLLIEPEAGGHLLRYARNELYPNFDEMDTSDLEGTDGRAYIRRLLSPVEWLKFAEKLNRCEIIEWKRKYYNNDVLDGTQWSIEIKIKGMRKISIYGSNEYPPYWGNFMSLLRREADPSIG